MFLGWVDQFTEWHLVLLDLLVDPADWQRRYGRSLQVSSMMGNRARMVERAFPELEGRRDFYDQLVRDLHARGLLGTESLHGTLSAGGELQPLGTDLARRFLAYLSPPRLMG